MERDSIMKNTDPPDSNHRDAKAEAGLNRFIEAWGSTLRMRAYPASAGGSWGCCWRRRTASAEEIASRLKVSRASVSTNIRMLSATGLVEKVAFLDKRHTFYLMAGDVWGKAIIAGREKVLAFKGIAEMGLAALPEQNEARNRLEEMIVWSNLMADVYQRILVEWQERRPIETLAE
jgi:DNA-binding transcriptional regulator GbsR (MarR family)